LKDYDDDDDDDHEMILLMCLINHKTIKTYTELT